MLPLDGIIMRFPSLLELRLGAGMGPRSMKSSLFDERDRNLGGLANGLAIFLSGSPNLRSVSIHMTLDNGAAFVNQMIIHRTSVEHLMPSEGYERHYADCPFCTASYHHDAVVYNELLVTYFLAQRMPHLTKVFWANAWLRTRHEESGQRGISITREENAISRLFNAQAGIRLETTSFNASFTIMPDYSDASDNVEPTSNCATLARAKDCIEILRILAGVVPGFGPQIQALVDVGICIILRTEQMQASKYEITHLCRKIKSVLEMIIRALQHDPDAPHLREGLMQVQSIFESIEKFKLKRQKRRSYFRLLTSTADCETIAEFETKLDDALKIITLSSGIQSGLDIQILKKLINKSLQQSINNSHQIKILKKAQDNMQEKLMKEFAVQTYGVAEDREDRDDGTQTETVHSGESSALLGVDAIQKRTPTKPDGAAGLTGSVGNLANTIIGSGMLTFPLAMASAGIIPGMISCILCGSIAVFGLYLLSRCATYTEHRRSSFFAVSKLTFPNAAIFFDAAIATKCFGVSISYLIIIKSLMPSVVRSLFHDLSSSGTEPPAWAVSGRVWLCLFMALLIPLCFLRKLDSLRHTSYVALFSVAYLILIVVVCYFNPPEGSTLPGDIHFVHFTPNFISTFPVQVFAFTCAQNLFPIYNELASNNQKRMNIVIGTAIGSATLTYEVIAVFGYLTFGSKVGANIIAMYPSTSLFIAIGQLAIVVLVLFSYPLQVHPCRNCLDKVFHDGGHLIIHKPVGEGDESNIDDEHAAAEMSPRKHALLTAGVIGFGFLIAFFVSDLQLVLSFVGSTGSTTISFILPGLFFWKLTRDDPNISKTLNRAALALAFYGGFIFIFW
ncbi:hypothetical protein EW145_g4823 [Phellinidium pouzarii]|uniref:Amino acid transporter transmembrane domain-containing protein n=1 Tax=Phellinidium pouzarii TaxID=167371 RepID=A0A4S4L3J2_9AGAM|nr:hypothetical protein EW145_g4823 [Phellinidium pouzarii]